MSKDQLEIDHGKVDRALELFLRFDIWNISRQQVILSASLNSVPGVKKQRCVRTDGGLGKRFDRVLQIIFAEVEMFLNLESEFAQLSGDCSRVVLRIHQAANVLVAPVADHESDAILSQARGAGGDTGEPHD